MYVTADQTVEIDDAKIRLLQARGDSKFFNHIDN